MPKPIFGINGSGMHTHLSLSKDGENAFADPGDEQGLSPTAYQFIAGLLAHARGFTAITNPLVNSYKRLVPGYEAPVYVAWSAKNRSALIRVPAAGGEGSRVELRSPDPSCNPYLAFAAIIAAGLDGIKRGLTPPPPTPQNIYHMTRRRARGARHSSLPGSLEEALSVFCRIGSSPKPWGPTSSRVPSGQTGGVGRLPHAGPSMGDGFVPEQVLTATFPRGCGPAQEAGLCRPRPRASAVYEGRPAQKNYRRRKGRPSPVYGAGRCAAPGVGEPRDEFRGTGGSALRFAKLHGLGNSYIYIDLVRQRGGRCRLARACPPGQRSGLWHRVGRPHLDLALRSGLADLRMRMFNADGSESEMCGNGIRCLARYAADTG